jgi:hypothetical protein
MGYHSFLRRILGQAKLGIIPATQKLPRGKSSLGKLSKPSEIETKQIENKSQNLESEVPQPNRLNWQEKKRITRTTKKLQNLLGDVIDEDSIRDTLMDNLMTEKVLSDDSDDSEDSILHVPTTLGTVDLVTLEIEAQQKRLVKLTNVLGVSDREIDSACSPTKGSDSASQFRKGGGMFRSLNQLFSSNSVEPVSPEKQDTLSNASSKRRKGSSVTGMLDSLGIKKKRQQPEVIYSQN